MRIEQGIAMTRSAVQAILHLIDTLSEADRALLQRYLREREETRWRKESDAARQEARQRGIDQTAIDEAVRKLRHGA